ncbi:MAG TPA: hypothetical protein VIM58_02180, partial [Candidatus Methylacidiphilales bacterium]
PRHPYSWLWEPFEAEPTFFLRPMFGARGAYLDGKLTLVFIARAEPWQGLLVCTAREHHPALMAAFPFLSPHEVLAKWLYLPEAAENFENAAEELVRAVLFRDPRIGVAPLPKKKKSARKKRTP